MSTIVRSIAHGKIVVLDFSKNCEANVANSKTLLEQCNIAFAIYSCFWMIWNDLKFTYIHENN